MLNVENHVLVGDFNAKSATWGEQNDKFGELLEHTTLDTDYIIINTRDTTRIPLHNKQKPSEIDLTLVTTFSMRPFNGRPWKTASEYPAVCTATHQPVVNKLLLCGDVESNPGPPKTSRDIETSPGPTTGKTGRTRQSTLSGSFVNTASPTQNVPSKPT
ncbi:nocturnin [Elysia marginata]|uniref:Nocturnin n=1 Tax=Elysia marginata TaxID=1093978 RepID=A0AAV4HGC8_9GAST|nr:nocturnin [Elysia marginata]